METGTGGAVTAQLSTAKDNALFFRGGLITQNPMILSSWGIADTLMDNYGVVSKEIAEAMASIARRQLGAEAGLAICASPGPDEFEGKPAGHIAIAVDLDGTVKSSEFYYRTKPAEIKRLASLAALNLLRRALLK
jgi:nicotinamide-nucleotide amidase